MGHPPQSILELSYSLGAKHSRAEILIFAVFRGPRACSALFKEPGTFPASSSLPTSPLPESGSRSDSMPSKRCLFCYRPEKTSASDKSAMSVTLSIFYDF